MNKINTVIFDIGNVLVDYCWQTALSNMNLPKDIEDRLAIATIKSKMWDEFDRGVLSDEEILNGFIANDPQIESTIRDFYDNHYHEIVKKYDYADEWIDTLKSHGFKIYFLSNFSRKGFEVFADDLSFVTKGDGAVISYKVKLIKPDREIYEYLLNEYNINPAEAVFIDDSEKNVIAAKAVGLNAIAFKNRQQVLDELKELSVY